MSRTHWWLTDIILAIFLTVLSTLVVWLQPGGPIQVVFALPLILVLPGYAFIAALYPSSTPNPTNIAQFDESRGRPTRDPPVAALDFPGRIGLSVVSSAVIVPLVVLLVNFSPIGLALLPALGGLTAVTVGLLFIAAGRRLQYPVGDRYALPAYFSRDTLLWTDDHHRFHASPWNATIPNVVLVSGLLIFASSLGYAAVVTPPTQSFTEVRVATDDMTGDTQTLYQSSFPRGQVTPLDVYVTNQEGERTDYTIVAVLQRIDRGDQSVRVTDSAVVDQRSFTLNDGVEGQITLSIEPTMGGSDHRLLVLLYRDSAPTDPAPDTAYRTLRLDVSITDSGGSSSRHLVSIDHHRGTD